MYKCGSKSSKQVYIKLNGLGYGLRPKNFEEGEDWEDTEEGLELCHDCLLSLVKESDDIHDKNKIQPKIGLAKDC